MTVESPTTFGDFWFSKRLEADNVLAGQIEKEVSGVSASLISDLHILDYIPSELQRLFSQITEPAGQHLGDIGGRFVSEVADGAVNQGASPFFQAMKYASFKLFPTTKITPEATAILYSRNKVSEDFFKERFGYAGFEDIEAQFQFDALRPYPTLADLITYSRYHGDPDNIWATLQPIYNVDPTDFKLWEWIARQRLTSEQVHTLFRRGKFDSSQLLTELAQIGWDAEDRLLQQELGWTIPNPMLLIQGGLMQGMSTDLLLTDIEAGDIHPDYTQRFMDAVLTKPSTQDIINLQLRKDPSLTKLDAELRKIGIHPDYFSLYKELAYIIPPVGDIITMAVREAFTPAIAERFGQYEDFPEPFADWAEKKGLSREWSERYWAAHWTLPSASQGFEMLHRGIINEDELRMLLRALDIMPFWRDRLIQISYTPLTRVDIRRMYAVGVLDEGQVKDAYMQIGYNEENADRMREFTVRQTFQTLSKFTSRDVIAAYTTRKIERATATKLLQNLGIRYEDIPDIIELADHKKKWSFVDLQVKGLRNLYKKGENDEDTTRDELRRLDLPPEQIEEYLKQWYYEEKVEEPKLWTAPQVLSLHKKGIIDKERAERELRDLGYDTEHVNGFLATVAIA